MALSLTVLLIATSVLTVLVLVYRPLPTIDGEYRLLGIEQRAQVDRDSFGVPHVWAQNAHDLFYLQGYVTAQDRLFQMDLYRRAAAGRLSEVLGEPTIDADKAMRTLGFARIAGQELDIARPDTRSALEAYAQGVNKFLEQHGDSLPIEFGILGYRPYLWTATDTILVGKLQAFETFQWHGETFSIPPGATRVMENAHCANQAYALGKHFGMQCHVEMTEDLVNTWLATGAEEIAASRSSPAVQSPADIKRDLQPRLAALNEVANRIYDRWTEGLSRGS